MTSPSSQLTPLEWDGTLATYPFDAGPYRRDDVSSTNAEAVEWFQLGLNWTMAFCHEEAIACFERAVVEDEGFAEAWHLISYSHGPDYNVHQNVGYAEISAQEAGYPCQKTATMAAGLALQHKARAGPAWAALIDAQQGRAALPFSEAVLEPYSEALRDVHEEFPDDADVAFFFADSLMQLTPWAIFDFSTKREAPHTAEAKAALLGGLRLRPQHPGLQHMLIHLLEMSPDPGECLPYIASLRTSAPDLGHLRHMPSHIDALVGNYADGVLANQRAWAADVKFQRFALGQDLALPVYAEYMAHDAHMGVYCAMLGGMEAAARDLGAKLRTYIEDCVRRYPEAAFTFDLYHPVFLHALVRFGRWEEVLEQEMPEEREEGKGENLLCGSATYTHYARGLAFAALGEVGKADAEREAFDRLRATEAVKTRIMHNNNAPDLFELAAHMLRGEIQYRRGEFEEAFANLREAVKREDGLHYDEPWSQMQSIRHALGALLLEQGHVDDATAVFREDLTWHPNNVWALTGLHNCLRKAKGAKNADSDELERVRAAVDAAAEHADFTVTAACGCAGLKIVSAASK